jgi:N utilization substance protein B
MDIAGTDLNDLVDEFLTYRFNQDDSGAGSVMPDATFFTELVRGVVRLQRDIDPVVDQQLKIGWRLTRVDATVRAILRAALFELLDRPDVPARVVINEYIEVAHAFFSDDEPRVVNGILDRLARKYRAGEFDGQRA